MNMNSLKNTICNEHNEWSEACGYSLATKDTENYDKCNMGMVALNDLVRALGLCNEFDKIKTQTTLGNVTFSYWKMIPKKANA